MTVFLGYFLGVAYAFLCIGIAVLLSRFGLPRPYSRKVVHILVGFEWVILRRFHGASIHFLLVCLLFLLFLFVAYRLSLLPTISSDADNAPGTIYYALAMSVMALFTLFFPAWMNPFGVAVFCTSFGDGFAGVIGQAIRRGNPILYRGKTLFGTLACFVFSFLAAFAVSRIFGFSLSLLACFAIAVLAAELELFSSHGFDNITVALGTFLLCGAFLFLPSIGHYLVSILLTPAVIGFVREKKILTESAVIIALVMDVAVTVSLGNFGFVLLLSFLAGGALVDRFKEKHCTHPDETEKNTAARDVFQVLANGLLPTLIALLFPLLPLASQKSAVLLLYTVALAEAFADTCASGFGAAAKYVFDPFRRTEVRGGISGGMSAPGTAAALGGGFLLAFVAYLFGAVSFFGILLAGACAFFGAVFDSFLGSVLQIKYRCPVCGVLTERKIHCSTEAKRAFGVRWMNNDAVNFISELFAVLLAFLFIL